VATISVTDAQGGTFTFTKITDADDKFNVSSSGVITLKNTVDYETKQSHQLTVRVADSGGLTYDETFTIAVTDVPEGTGDLSIRVANPAAKTMGIGWDTGPGISVTPPISGHSGGDLLVAMVRSYEPPATPSGWTLAGQQRITGAATYGTLSVYTRTATGSDAVTFTAPDVRWGNWIIAKVVAFANATGLESLTFGGGQTSLDAVITGRAITTAGSSRIAMQVYAWADTYPPVGSSNPPTGPAAGWSEMEVVTNTDGYSETFVVDTRVVPAATTLTAPSRNATRAPAEEVVAGFAVYGSGGGTGPASGTLTATEAYPKDTAAITGTHSGTGTSTSFDTTSEGFDATDLTFDKG
jgi:hypothetical protein